MASGYEVPEAQRSGITYIWVEAKGWCYLASVMDLCTRKIVGWRFSEKAEAKMALRHSYSAKGTPLDNAPIESFHAILKKEEVYAKIYKKVDEARQSLFRYIEGFYNMRRLHSALGYLSPIEYENIINSKAS